METKYLRLGSVCSKIGSGATPIGGKEAYQGGGYKLIRSQNVVDLRFAYEGLAEINEKQATKLNNVKVEEKDVLLNITGDSVARCCLAPIGILPARVNQHVAIIRPKAEILNPYYLLFWLIVNKQYLLALAAAGATRNGLTKAMISGLVIECPSLEKQNRIASILSTYDSLIENNAKRIRLLEKMAENLYKEWFVRFRYPGHENVEMENGLPKGWTVEKVKDWCRVFTGRKDVNQTVEGGKYAFFSCSPNMFHSDEYIYDGKAVLIAGNGSYTGRTRYFEGKFDLYQRTYAVVSDRPDDDFLFYLFLRFKYDFEPLHNGGTRGSAIPYIVMKDITKYKFLYDTDIVKCYTERVKPMFDEIDNLQHQNSLLARQRDLLLPRLMSGKLEVKEELLE